MLEIIDFQLGPVLTNAYLVADGDSKQAVVIDPAWDGKTIVDESIERGWKIEAIWLTHAHFDHLGGAAEVYQAVTPPPPAALHPDDYPLWQMQGGAPYFGMKIDPGPEPTTELQHGNLLTLGAYRFEVRHAPGHTPGHVVYYCESEKVCFCGDVIFRGSIGRTDLPGGSYQGLINSIRSQILTLPDDVRLFNGHGPETSVGVERASNPFLS
jgi:glyoxylase-like metal-dependent hydrolase (beta-lactamase superfamily II)